MTEKIKAKDDSVKVIAGANYNDPGRTLLKIKDTGNGLICKFPAWRNVEQDHYICLDYAQASYLKHALQHVKNLDGDESGD